MKSQNEKPQSPFSDGEGLQCHATPLDWNVYGVLLRCITSYAADSVGIVGLSGDKGRKLSLCDYFDTKHSSCRTLKFLPFSVCIKEGSRVIKGKSLKSSSLSCPGLPLWKINFKIAESG